jgi:hypothetical protein
MWKWLSTMLNAKTDFTDYAFFEKTFDTAVTANALNAAIKLKYFTSDNALENAKRTIGGAAGAP